MVVVMSHDAVFLDAFAEWSLRGRLLVWSTRLVVVTRLALPQLQAIMLKHWTFAMMNTIVLSIDDTSRKNEYLSIFGWRCGTNSRKSLTLRVLNNRSIK